MGDGDKMDLMENYVKILTLTSEVNCTEEFYKFPSMFIFVQENLNKPPSHWDHGKEKFVLEDH